MNYNLLSLCYPFFDPACDENNLKNKQVKVNKGGELKEQNTYKLA